MTFREYQLKAKETAHFPDPEIAFIYTALGLMGEAGEVSEKIKKIWRDKNKQVNASDKEEIKKEIGDVLWYLSQLAEELGIDFDDVAATNLAKTHSRLERNLISGSGDNR
ncbi:MAG: nucleoside triphosphate pyrophosphohydrolase family protein [Patescibacteria group bacterium]